jgi:hypothetical protein
MCVLSTGHITEEVAQALETFFKWEVTTPWIDALIIYPHGDYGWLIYIPDEGLDAELPPSLEACIALARASRCQWLLLDRDASQVTNIPTYEW